MNLTELIHSRQVRRWVKSGEADIFSLTEDSRQVQRGSLFFARKGLKTSGVAYAQDAVQRGAVAVVSEEEIPNLSVPTLQVHSLDEAQKFAVEKFYGDIAQHFVLIGITGTNGKTTLTYLLEQIAVSAQKRCAVLGTINYRIPKLDGTVESIMAPNTTPNLLELYRVLDLARREKVDWVAMEVSSHALSLGRVHGLFFDGAIFTNLTQDHLDYHQTMENYFLAKRQLFERLRMKSPKKNLAPFAVYNADDSYGKRIVETTAAKKVSYAIHHAADIKAEELELSRSGSCCKIQHKSGTDQMLLQLMGEHNVANALAAFAAGQALGVEERRILLALEAVQNIPGRLQKVDAGQDFLVLVDYAHTEDALKNVLSAIQKIEPARILTLFGCGGDRDRGKRPKMGEVASAMSDWVYLTSDNPRSEDPEQIALDVEVGLRRTNKNNYTVIVDRRQAIAEIIAQAKKGDAILLAGKGHETYQIYKDQTVHFDDSEEALNAIRVRGKR